MIFTVYLLVIIKNVIYGSSIFFTSGLTESTDVLDILALRFLMSFVVMWLLKVTRILKIEVGVRDMFVKNERSPHIMPLLLTALFEPVLYMFFETLGVSMTSNITAGVILSLTPITCCIAESLILKESTTLMQKVFLGIGIFGVIFIAVNTDTSSGRDTLAGIVIMFIAIIVDALFTVFSRKSSSHFTAMEITYAACTMGMIVFNSVNVVRHIANGTIGSYFAPYFSTENLIGFVFLGVVSTIAATAMVNFVLRYIKASSMSAFGGVSTFVTIFIGVAIGGERLYPFHFIGLIFIIIRMIGVSYIDIKKDSRLTK